MTQIAQSRFCPRLAPASLLAALLLAGCVTTGEVAQEPVGPDYAPEPGDGPVEMEDGRIVYERDRDETGETGETDSERGVMGESELFPGTGRFYDPEATEPRSGRPGEDGEITLNFEGQGIQEVVHAVLGHMLEENYVIAPGVSGEVTFATARPLARDQIMPVLEMLLRWNGATLIWREGSFHVVPISDAVAGNLVPRFDAAEKGRGYEILAVPLEYISAGKMAEILEPYAREDGIFNADNARGMLFLAGTRYELRNYMQIIETFDVDWLEGMSVGMFTLNRIEAEELLGELESVFGDEGETPLAGMFRFVPMERLNAIMVITPNEQYLEEAEKWIRRLDRSSTEAGSRLYVYRVKNLEAGVLAGYLGDLFGGSGSAGSQRRREDRGGVAPGMEEASVSSVGQFQRDQAERTREQDDGGNGTTPGGLTLGEDEDVRITAVEETNSLLIQAPPGQYDAILNAIERIDEEPLQVLIEAQIIEVTLNDTLRYGVSWFLSNSWPDSDDFPGFPGGDDAAQFAESRAQDSASIGPGGMLTTLTRRGGTNRTFVAATLNLLETVSDVRTLSTPSLLVRNNSSANINVGRQVPIQSTSISGGSDRVFGTTQYLNTGVIMDVTPRVNPGGLVYLEVDQEVSSPGDVSGDNQNPPVDTRRVSTEVAVQSGQTVILGGLIQESNTRGNNGLPVISRIPGLGALFGSRSRSVSRSETLVLITPTVLESTSRLEEITRDLQTRFGNVKPISSD